MRIQFRQVGVRYFNPRSPCGERLFVVVLRLIHDFISIHALLAESDSFTPSGAQHRNNFNPRSPCGERLRVGRPRHGGVHHFNPRSPCGERHKLAQGVGRTRGFQSTLSLRRATGTRGRSYYTEGFQSTLSLRRATAIFPRSLGTSTFQSTLSLRRATRMATTSLRFIWHFNPRSPCGERQGRCRRPLHGLDFNPRSPCGERHLRGVPPGGAGQFQSTLSLRRATIRTTEGLAADRISIHALLAESDPRGRDCVHHHAHFNPRSPCGERLEIRETDTPEQIFQSTLSLRRATGHPKQSVRTMAKFQSTLSLRRATWSRQHQPCCLRYFNPRSPCGERLSASPGVPGA